MISAFKSLRAVFSVYAASNVEIVRAFNWILAKMETPEGRVEVEQSARFGDVSPSAEDIGELHSYGAQELYRYKDADITGVVAAIFRGPRGIPPLDARMLIRHASGQFFQEAHFELERTSQVQKDLWGGLSPRPLTVMITEEAAAADALRALRKAGPWTESRQEEYFLSLSRDRESVSPTGWMPKTYRFETLLKSISPDMPGVDDLFEVNQGALTGMNEIFVLSRHELMNLPESERRFFRPAAGTNTIQNGRLVRSHFVFYPYDEDGLVLRTEEHVRESVGEFYPLRRDRMNRWTLLVLTTPRSPLFLPRRVTLRFGFPRPEAIIIGIAQQIRRQNALPSGPMKILLSFP